MYFTVFAVLLDEKKIALVTEGTELLFTVPYLNCKFISGKNQVFYDETYF